MALLTHHHILLDADSGAEPGQDVTGETFTFVAVEAGGVVGALRTALSVGEGEDAEVRLVVEAPGGIVLAEERITLDGEGEPTHTATVLPLAREHVFSGVQCKITASGTVVPPVTAKAVLYANTPMRVNRQGA